MLKRLSVAACGVGRYWTVDPKSDKMEGLAVPTALQDSLVAHSGSLATASVLFTLAAPLQVCS